MAPGLKALRLRAARRLSRELQGRTVVLFALTACLMVVGAFAAISGSGAVARSDAKREMLAFRFGSEQISSTLQLAIQHEEDLVVSASAFVASHPHVSPAAFDRWVESVHAIQRYPELENIGLVNFVPAASLAAFQAAMGAHPLRPFGRGSVGPRESGIVPPGRHPYYCLASAGLARSQSSYVPAGLDYCEVAPSLESSRTSGQANFAPFSDGATTDLAVETPVYRGGLVPRTIAARRRDFDGWLGELLVPGIVLRRALEGHPNVAVTFRYDAHHQKVTLKSGRAPHDAQTMSINLHNGWTVQTFGPRASAGISHDGYALTLLVGGVLLCLMFGLLAMVLATSRRRALSLVSEKTRELSHQALHDMLTGLPNRALVIDRAEQLIARTSREPSRLAGALFIDIDGFKHVNDNLGHGAGDQLLRTIGERLQATVRDGDTVGRLGGDEFVVLVEASAGEDGLNALADRLTEVLREPIELDDGRKISSVTASIGVAIGRYATPDALLRDADLALYAAKADGKDRYALFEPGMQSGVEGRRELQADLAAALPKGQFFLDYQPIFSLPDREVVAVEALIRWRHPERGIVMPDDFVPLAEESGLIVAIGRWVIQTACAQAAEWAARGTPLGVSVNVSAHQIDRRNFADDVRRVLEATGLAASALTLEITETVLMRDASVASAQLEELRARGVRIAIDDFGTGYASLSNLQRVPVDILKVDRSFVAALNDGGQSSELLSAVLGVGRALALDVVAEGVEKPSQLLALEEMGCAMAQGFLMGRPVAAAEIRRGDSAGVGARAS